MESASDDGLGANLRRVRELRGYTQDALAVVAGVTRGYVASIEGGRITNPGAYTLYALAGALGVTVEALLGRPALALEPSVSRRPGAAYTLVDAQHELERRLALVGAEPFGMMTEAQFDAYAPDTLVSQAELTEASELAVASHLPDGLRHAPEWMAFGFYAAGALAMALRDKNSPKN